MVQHHITATWRHQSVTKESSKQDQKVTKTTPQKPQCSTQNASKATPKMHQSSTNGGSLCAALVLTRNAAGHEVRLQRCACSVASVL